MINIFCFDYSHFFFIADLDFNLEIVIDKKNLIFIN